MSLLTKNVGLSFRGADSKEHFRSLGIGEELELEREPHNQYDANAVAVYHAGFHLGFIPKTDNEELAAHLDDGGPYLCRIVSFQNPQCANLEIEFGE